MPQNDEEEQKYHSDFYFFYTPMIDYSKIQETVQDIYDIKIQGATKIAKSAFEVVAEELGRQEFDTRDEVKTFVKEAFTMLRNARDTEPLMFNGIRYVFSKIDECTMEDKEAFQDFAKKTCEEFMTMIEDTQKRAIEMGKDILPENAIVFNHCHSTSAIKTIIANRDNGKNVKVFNTETRPRCQGRLTSTDFVNAGIDDTMVPDSSAAYILSKFNDFGIKVDAVILGCDCIKMDGDVFNKTGSYGICSAAFHNDIPVYIAGTFLKTDTEGVVKIEMRSADEVWAERPEGLKVLNPAFGRIPAIFITGIITEFGIIKPKDYKEELKKHYPWMLD